jgi:hypothetical protein
VSCPVCSRVKEFPAGEEDAGGFEAVQDAEPEEGIQHAKLNAGWRVITKEVIQADTIFAKLRGVWYTW